MKRICCVFTAFVAASAVFSAKPDEVVVLEGRREPSEAGASVKAMKYLPFTVPPGVTRITIHKDLQQGPGTQRGTIDHGLFDPRGTAFGGPGFRGWMGGSGEDIAISGRMADSRFFIGGPIQPGTWNLAQSYLRSSPAGLKYKYTVRMSFGDVKPSRTMPRVPRYDPGVLENKPGWYPGSLHNHTVASDGGLTLEQLVRHDKELGFRFLAATDHNTVRQHFEFAKALKADPSFLILYGEEMTSPGGHANIIGMPPGAWYDFRFDPGSGMLPKVIARAHAQGAIFSINHPYAGCLTCEWRYPDEEYRDADAIEVWNGGWGPANRAALQMWDAILKDGRRIIALGGPDYHRGNGGRTPATWVYARNLSGSEVLAALRRGRVTLSETPQSATITITARNGAVLPGDSVKISPDETLPIRVRAERAAGLTVHIVWDKGETTLARSGEAAGETLLFNVPREARYVRAELHRANDRVAALTNPIYIERG